MLLFASVIDLANAQSERFSALGCTGSRPIIVMTAATRNAKQTVQALLFKKKKPHNGKIFVLVIYY
jgi:hypothetical protein